MDCSEIGFDVCPVCELGRVQQCTGRRQLVGGATKWGYKAGFKGGARGLELMG